MKTRVVVLRGLPGSGKSYYAKSQDAAIVSADSYPGLYEEDGSFHPELLAEAHAHSYWSFLMFLREPRMLEGAELILVDNTNLSAWEISPYMLGAAAFGASASILQFDVPPEVCFARQTHGVPKEAFDRMVEKFNSDLLPFWQVNSFK